MQQKNLSEEERKRRLSALRRELSSQIVSLIIAHVFCGLVLYAVLPTCDGGAASVVVVSVVAFLALSSVIKAWKILFPQTVDAAKELRMLKKGQTPPARKEHWIEQNGLDRLFKRAFDKTIGECFETDLCDLNSDGVVTEEEEIKSFILFSNLMDDDP